MRIQRLLTLISLILCTNCLAFSIVAVTPSRSLWLEVKNEAEKRVTAKPSPTLDKVLLKKWLAKMRAKPDFVDAADLDLLREDWSSGVDISMLRDVLKKAYIAAPQLRESFAAMRLEAFLFLQVGDVKSARDSLAAIRTWCEKPNSAGYGFDQYQHCPPSLLSWIADGKFSLDADTMPERVELQEQTIDCANTGNDDVPDLLEFDLVDDVGSTDAVARLGMRYIWDALLQGCSQKYNVAALRVLARRLDALSVATDLALQQLEQAKHSADFVFLHDRLPWPKMECDYARSPVCALHREFSAQHKRYVLQRIVALAADLSITTVQDAQRQQRAERLLAKAQSQLRQHNIAEARSSFVKSLNAAWDPDPDFSIRLIDALLQGAAAPASVNPKPAISGWTYEFEWFDEHAFENNRLIYAALLPPHEFLKLQRMQSWERVLAQASYLVNEEATTKPAGPLLQLQGSWHGDYLQVADLQLPWPAKFDWFLASYSKPLPEQERIALFARMQVIVSD